VGDVVSKLNEERFRKETGSSAGSISFAINASVLPALIEERPARFSPMNRTAAIKLVSQATCKVLTATTKP
jgi:hypothetical protein